ncbi:MAG: DUF1349 domain-containing protein [Bacteroidales bacterium]|jgi:hypothetical protein|nr:DUF1349 domain-containing protein [Bacteroidales bacterium]
MKNNSAQKRPVKGDHPVYFISKAVSLFSYSMAAALLLISCNTVKNSAEMKDISLRISGIEFPKAIKGAEKHFAVNDSLLVVDGTGGSNYFISPDGMRAEATAPVLLTEIDNSKPFTFTARVESKVEKIYDAGTIYIYIDNENWLKFAFERDKKLRYRVVTVRTDGDIGEVVSCKNAPETISKIKCKKAYYAPSETHHSTYILLMPDIE